MLSEFLAVEVFSLEAKVEMLLLGIALADVSFGLTVDSGSI